MGKVIERLNKEKELEKINKQLIKAEELLRMYQPYNYDKVKGKFGKALFAEYVRLGKLSEKITASLN